MKLDESIKKYKNSLAGAGSTSELFERNEAKKKNEKENNELHELTDGEQKQVTGGTEPNVLPGETAEVGEMAYNKGHCGIYMGPGGMVHAPTAGEVKSEGQE